MQQQEESAYMISVGWQIGICLCASFILLVVCLVLNKVKKKENNNVDKRGKYDLFIAIFIFVFGLLFVNVCFTLTARIEYGFESVLKYSETQQMVISALVASCIAFIQLKIQRAIENKNKKESEQREVFHVNEVKSERIKDMQIFSKIKAYGLNFNIPKCKAIYADMYNELSEPVFFIHIYADNDYDQIYPQYFKPNKKDGIKVKIDGYNEAQYTFNADSGKIDICFKGLSEKLNEFFSMPTRPALFDKEMVTLQVIIEYTGTDTSYDDEKYSEFNFSLEFNLIPCSGYNEKGKFSIKIIDPNICRRPTKRSSV